MTHTAFKRSLRAAFPSSGMWLVQHRQRTIHTAHPHSRQEVAADEFVQARLVTSVGLEGGGGVDGRMGLVIVAAWECEGCGARAGYVALPPEC